MNRAILIFASLTLGSVSADAKTWAAQFPIGNGELSPVFHARPRDAALAKAIKFCRETEVCLSEHPDGEIKEITAVGVVGHSNLFVTTACPQENGEFLYVTVPTIYDDAAGRTDGKVKGEEQIHRSGYLTENCTIHAVYGVKSRRRLQTDLMSQALEQNVEGLKGEVRTYKVQRRNATRTATEIVN
jgi:hypothetical protein